MKINSTRTILAAAVLALMTTMACGGPAAPEAAAVRCAMCGVAQKPVTAATVVLREGRRVEYCCPHCAVMGMSLAEYASKDIERVLLSDFRTAERIPADEATIVFEPRVVPCCAPGIVAFRDSAAAAAFREAEGGEILAWRAIVETMLKRRCEACGMVLYPPTAIRIDFASGTKSLACCPVCALGLVLATEAVLNFSDAATGAAVRVTRAADGSIAADPSAARFWIGMKTVDNERKPAGCHFNFVFASPESLAAWRAAHPAADGLDLSPAEALEFARKAMPMMQAKRRERLQAAGLPVE